MSFVGVLKLSGAVCLISLRKEMFFCTDNGLAGSQDKYAHGFGLAFSA